MGKIQIIESVWRVGKKSVLLLHAHDDGVWATVLHGWVYFLFLDWLRKAILVTEIEELKNDNNNLLFIAINVVLITNFYEIILWKQNNDYSSVQANWLLNIDEIFQAVGHAW